MQKVLNAAKPAEAAGLGADRLHQRSRARVDAALGRVVVRGVGQQARANSSSGGANGARNGGRAGLSPVMVGSIVSGALSILMMRAYLRRAQAASACALRRHVLYRVVAEAPGRRAN